MEFLIQINIDIDIVKNQFPNDNIKHLLYEIVEESKNNFDHNVKRLFNYYGLDFFSEEKTRDFLDEIGIKFEHKNEKSFFHTINGIPRFKNNLDKFNLNNDQEIELINNSIDWLPEKFKMNYGIIKDVGFNSVSLYFNDSECLNCNNPELNEAFKDKSDDLVKQIDKLILEISSDNYKLFNYSSEDKTLGDKKYLSIQMDDKIKDINKVLIPLDDISNEVKYLIEESQKWKIENILDIYKKSKFQDAIWKWVSSERNRAYQNIISDYRLEQFDIAKMKEDKTEAIIKQKFVHEIKNLIRRAKKYILIASYIIEDEDLCDFIIMQKKKNSLDVYIITSFRDDLKEKMKTIEGIKNSKSNKYEKLDYIKTVCYKKLLKAGCLIRHSDSHLKLISTDNLGFVGSINLTSNSLHSNIESAVIIRNKQDLEELVKFYRNIWINCTSHSLGIWKTSDGIYLSDIETNKKSYTELLQFQQSNLLGVKAFYKDLEEELKSNPYSKTTICTMNLAMDSLFINRLKKNEGQVKLKYDSSKTYSKRNDNLFKELPTNFTLIPHTIITHAKYVLLGEDILYIGGINFTPNNNKNNMFDLMYKITDKAIIRKFIKMERF